jgi:hypothetical protein
MSIATTYAMPSSTTHKGMNTSMTYGGVSK